MRSAGSRGGPRLYNQMRPCADEAMSAEEHTRKNAQTTSWENAIMPTRLARRPSTVTTTPKPAYFCIARAVLLNPPIAHRHTPPTRNYLSAFEFKLMAAIIAAARRQWRKVRHQQAFATSGKVLKR